MATMDAFLISKVLDILIRTSSRTSSGPLDLLRTSPRASSRTSLGPLTGPPLGFPPRPPQDLLQDILQISPQDLRTFPGPPQDLFQDLQDLLRTSFRTSSRTSLRTSSETSSGPLSRTRCGRNSIGSVLVE